MRAYEIRERDGLRRKYRIEPTPTGQYPAPHYRVMRLGFAYFPLTNEGIRAGMEPGPRKGKWYLLAEVRTLNHAFAIASMRARESGAFVPLEARYWKEVAA